MDDFNSDVKIENSVVIEEGDEENHETVVNPTWIDRDLSWLKFNDRVLYQVQRKDLSLDVKIKFIGIASSNLDEFISVRFSYAYHQYIKADDSETEKYYKKLLEAISKQKKDIEDIFSYYYDSVLTKIGGSNSKKDKTKKYFNTEIFSAITLIGVDKNKDIPRFSEKDLNIFIKFKINGSTKYCFIQIPHELGRFLKIGKERHFIEDVVIDNISSIFNTSRNIEHIVFKVTKQYDEEIQTDSRKSIIERIEDVLKKRRDNNIIYLDIFYGNNKKEKLVKNLYKLLKVPKNHVHISNIPRAIGLQFLTDDIKIPSELDEKSINWIDDFTPRIPSDLFGENSILDYLSEDDLILHHPYDSYDIIINFLNEAANDKNVISIKQTLYRVSSLKSPIIKALCLAAQNGKRVTVMLEVLARFNEKMNIELISKLREAGCNVVYSMDSIKTHCKICIVSKKTKKEYITYSHISTGNYNEETASVYTDISYLTSKSNIGHDLNSIFNMISGFTSPENLKTVSFSPITLRKQLEYEINQCALNGTVDKPALIKIKVNSISDTDMVNKLYQATDNKNVNINIICRGICSIVSKENIKIKSIIGRFLEHSRIYIFEYGDTKNVYISSADLLTRNLDRRIEILMPLKRKCKKKIQDIFSTLWSDEANSFIMDGTGEFNQHTNYDKEDAINAHNLLMKG